MTPFHLLGIDHVVLRIADLDRSLAFYVGVLGCTVDRAARGYRPDPAPGGPFADRSRASGWKARKGGRRRRRAPKAATSITSRSRSRRSMKPRCAPDLGAHGVAVEEVARRYGAKGYGPSIYIADPDGNKVELQRPTGTHMNAMPNRSDCFEHRPRR